MTRISKFTHKSDLNRQPTNKTRQKQEQVIVKKNPDFPFYFTRPVIMSAIIYVSELTKSKINVLIDGMKLIEATKTTINQKIPSTLPVQIIYFNNTKTVYLSDICVIKKFRKQWSHSNGGLEILVFENQKTVMCIVFMLYGIKA